MLKIISATTPEDLDIFRAMVREFSDWALKTFHPDEALLLAVARRIAR